MKRQRLDRIRILALLIVLLGIVYFYLNLFKPSAIPPLFRLGVIRRPFNLLIVGTDITYDAETRKPIPGLKGRADTILILHLEPAQQQLNVLSIPRDAYVFIPEMGMQRINAAQVYGGIDLTEQTISDFTGLRLDGYLEMNPQAIISLVDLLGGVYLEVEKDMQYTDHSQGLQIDLKQGWRKLSGAKAHDYLRFRYDAEGDLGRISRQQKFLKTLFGTMAKPFNLLKAPLAISIGLRNIKTDLSLRETVRLLNSFRMMDASDVHLFSLFVKDAEVKGLGKVLVIDRVELEQIVGKHF